MSPPDPTPPPDAMTSRPPDAAISPPPPPAAAAAAAEFPLGLVSVTFRRLSPREIVSLVARARLNLIEWGGDVHVPHGDLARAAEVRSITEDAGLATAAYGSYLRLGEADPDELSRVIDTARALGAPAVRVWAGRRASKDADADYRRRVIEQALQLADLAAAPRKAAPPDAAAAAALHGRPAAGAGAGASGPSGIAVCYEFHEGTLTDTDDSTAALLAATEHPAIRTLWQPPHEQPLDVCLASLHRVLPRLQHVHVFHWPRRDVRAPLADGRDRWAAYVKLLTHALASGVPHAHCPLLLEFVRDDDPAQLFNDADALRAIIATAAEARDNTGR